MASVNMRMGPDPMLAAQVRARALATAASAAGRLVQSGNTAKGKSRNVRLLQPVDIIPALPIPPSMFARDVFNVVEVIRPKTGAVTIKRTKSSLTLGEAKKEGREPDPAQSSLTRDRLTCKERPDNTKRRQNGSGGMKKFIPWCG